jgi:hydrogenase nickel incorporation protein HypA/HybF
VHELSLAEHALAIIEETARREGFTRVHRVRVEVGRLSHVEPDALRFAFSAVCVGSCADGAVLEIIDIPGEGECPQCRTRSPMDAEPAWCPRCESSPLRVVGGTRMAVRDVFVDDAGVGAERP